MTVEELKNKMSYEEFIDWMAFYQIEPFGPSVNSLGHAVTSSVIANVNRNPKKQKKPYKPDDFLIKVDRAKKILNPKKTMVQLEKLRATMEKRSDDKCK